MMSDLNASLEKLSGFVSFLLFAFTLVIKLRNVDFKLLKYFDICL